MHNNLYAHTFTNSAFDKPRWQLRQQQITIVTIINLWLLKIVTTFHQGPFSSALPVYLWRSFSLRVFCDPKIRCFTGFDGKHLPTFLSNCFNCFQFCWGNFSQDIPLLVPSPNALLSLSDQILVGQSFVSWKLKSSFHEGNQDTTYVYTYIYIYTQIRIYDIYIYIVYTGLNPWRQSVFRQSDFRGGSRERCKGVTCNHFA